jgi:hypothetical protein
MVDEIPIACALTSAEEARRLALLERELFGAALDRRDLVDGYEFRFPGDAHWLTKLAAFIADERACCPFLAFEIVCEPAAGPIWLRLRGREGVKDFIAVQFLSGSQGSEGVALGSEVTT